MQNNIHVTGKVYEILISSAIYKVVLEHYHAYSFIYCL